MTEDVKIEQWLYAGRRQAKNGLLHAWQRPTGKIVYFKKVRGYVIGAAYKVELVFGPNDALSVRGDAGYVETGVATHMQIERWEAEDAAAYQTVERQREEKRAAKDSEMQAALEVLRRHHAALSSYASMRAFQEWVAGEVQRPPERQR